ncbi:hypothetical protein LACDD01_02182 [Lactococcus sp. DD01]|nr:hypothetical protein LACDD01_02182 [Lactococcus sp. DD01]
MLQFSYFDDKELVLKYLEISKPKAFIQTVNETTGNKSKFIRTHMIV